MQAYEQVIIDQRDWMFRLASSLDKGGAEDLVQEASLRALDRPPRHDGNIRAWLRKIIKNLHADGLRSDTRAPRPEDLLALELPSTLSELSLKELRSIIEDELASLDPIDREIIELRFFEGLPPRMIVRRLASMSHSAVTYRLRSTMALLRERLDRKHGAAHWRLAMLPVFRALHAESAATSVAPLPLAAAAIAVIGTGAILFGIVREGEGRIEGSAPVTNLVATSSRVQVPEVVLPPSVERAPKLGVTGLSTPPVRKAVSPANLPSAASLGAPSSTPPPPPPPGGMDGLDALSLTPYSITGDLSLDGIPVSGYRVEVKYPIGDRLGLVDHAKVWTIKGAWSFDHLTAGEYVVWLSRGHGAFYYPVVVGQGLTPYVKIEQDMGRIRIEGTAVPERLVLHWESGDQVYETWADRKPGEPMLIDPVPVGPATIYEFKPKQLHFVNMPVYTNVTVLPGGETLVHMP